jgi:hypothetical protein
MRETARAKAAFNDYLTLGPGRSLEKLLERYRTVPNPPTTRLPTLKGWSARFGWQERLAEIAERERQAIVARGIVDKESRVAVADEWLQAMRRLREARAKDPLLVGVPGGETGLLVPSPKLVKVYATPDEPATDGEGEELVSAKRDVLVYEYAFDAALAKEVREYLKYAAQERGEWTEKREVTGKDGGPIDMKVEDAREQLAARLAALAARRREGEADSQPGPTGSGEAAA